MERGPIEQAAWEKVLGSFGVHTMSYSTTPVSHKHPDPFESIRQSQEAVAKFRDSYGTAIGDERIEELSDQIRSLLRDANYSDGQSLVILRACMDRLKFESFHI